MIIALWYDLTVSERVWSCAPSFWLTFEFGHKQKKLPTLVTYHNQTIISTTFIYRSRWRSGLARLQQWPCYLQGPGFESHLRPVEFFACKKVSPLNNRTPTLTSVPCAPIILLNAIRGACKTCNKQQATRCSCSPCSQSDTLNIRLINLCDEYIDVFLEVQSHKRAI